MLIESRGYWAGTSRSGSRSWDSWGKGNQIIEGLPQRFIDRLRRGAAADTDPASFT
ncbi:MAG: hypothetical protein ACLRM8_00315 [Alistipes sp.]